MGTLKAGTYYVGGQRFIIEDGDKPEKFKARFKKYPQFAKASGYDTKKRRDKSSAKSESGQSSE